MWEWCFFWPLASLFLSPFSSSQEEGGNKLFYNFFWPPPFLWSSTNIHQQSPQQDIEKGGWLPSPFLWSSTNIHQQPPQQDIEKGHGYHPLFEKPFFGPKHHKAAKTLNPLLGELCFVHPPHRVNKLQQDPWQKTFHMELQVACRWDWGLWKSSWRTRKVRHQNFRGCSATPVLHLQNAIKSRRSAATRVARQGVPAIVCN